MGWCHLRQLPIHAELATELWCHHWTARPPRLPVMGDGAAAGATSNVPANRQLSLAAVFQES